MNKKTFAILSLVIILFISTSVSATDLPIDINAIGRQGQSTGSVMPRIGANLFTDDARRVNEVFAERIRSRQETSRYLFAVVPRNYIPDPHVQLTNIAAELSLFAVPVNFNNFTALEEPEPLPIWITVSIFLACIIAGFVLALMSRARKRRRMRGVH